MAEYKDREVGKLTQKNSVRKGKRRSMASLNTRGTIGKRTTAERVERLRAEYGKRLEG